MSQSATDVEQQAENDILPAILVEKQMRELCGVNIRAASLEHCTRLLDAAAAGKDRDTALAVLCHAKPEVAWDLRRHAAGDGDPVDEQRTAMAAREISAGRVDAPRWGGPDEEDAQSGPPGSDVLEDPTVDASSTPIVTDGAASWTDAPTEIKATQDAAGFGTGFVRIEDGKTEHMPVSGQMESPTVAEFKHGAQMLCIPLDQIITVEQPRKFFDEAKLAALAASIKQHGVINPPMLRPLEDGRYMVVAGERRCRAARLLGLSEIRAFVREMSIEDVMDVQAAENLHRDDLTPLEEGLHYYRQSLPIDEGGLGRTVKQIAARSGFSEAHVYGRRALAYLCPEGVRALERGQVSATVAEQVARIPEPARQAKAVEDLLRMRPAAERDEDREPLSSRQAMTYLRQHYMLDLARAPFDLKDEFLLVEAGPCVKCPHNSGNQPADLFQLPRSKAQCLKPSCYGEKVSALWAQTQEQARQHGHASLSLKKGQALYANGFLAHDAPYVELSAPCPEDTKRRTWRELLGESLPSITVAPDANARPHELVDKNDALVALVKEGHKFARKAQERAAPPQDSKPRVESDQEKLENEVRARSRTALIEDAVKIAEKSGLTAKFLQLIAEGQLVAGGWKAMVERRGIQDGKASIDGCLKYVEKADEAERRGIVVELALLEYFSSTDGDDLRPLSKRLGLSIRDIEARVRQTMEAEAATADKQDKPKKSRGGKAR